MTDFKYYVNKKIDKVKILDYLGFYSNKNKTRYSLTEQFYCACDCGTMFSADCERLVSIMNSKKPKLSCGSCCSHKDHTPTKHPNKYTFGDKCVYIHLDNHKEVAIIDIEDYEKVKDYRWNYSNGYFQCHMIRNWKKLTCGLHRLIMDLYEPDLVVDHINRNPLDNRKCNLRIVTKTQNHLNAPLIKRPLYGIAGISKSNNKWIASVSRQGKTIRLGSFDSLKDAVSARKEAEIKYYGMNRVY